STPVHPFLGIWKIGANLAITRESLQGKNAHHRQQNYGGGNLVSAYGVQPAPPEFSRCRDGDLMLEKIFER
ncbi:MAG: hypothetical protein Q8Q55_00750, partial [Undibacterium sp.]|nr:hypothetical protein [Undibacterium sp.]